MENNITETQDGCHDTIENTFMRLHLNYVSQSVAADGSI